MSLFNLASKYAAPAIAAVLLAVVSGLYVRGNVLETQRDSARVDRDNARTVILGLQDQAKDDAIDLALLRQSKAAIDDTAANQDARTLATVTRQSRVLANIEKELRDARSNLEGVDALGGTLTRVLSEQRDNVAATLQSRARRIAGDQSGPVRPASEPKGDANDTATDARYDGHVGRGDHRHPIDLRSHPDWLGGDWLVRLPELAGAVAQPEDVSQSEENYVWLMEVHAWSTETHDRAPAFHPPSRLCFLRRHLLVLKPASFIRIMSSKNTTLRRKPSIKVCHSGPWCSVHAFRQNGWKATARTAPIGGMSAHSF